MLPCEGVLYRRSKPNIPLKLVIWDPDERLRIISELHDLPARIAVVAIKRRNV